MKRGTSARKRATILIADPEGVFRLGLKKLFGVEDDLRVVAQAENAIQAAAMARSFQPDLIFIQSGLATNDLYSQTRRHASSSKVVVMTAISGENAGPEHLRNGAAGVIAKSVSPETFVKCARRVMAGETWIPKEQVLRMVDAAGKNIQRPLRPADTLTRQEKTIISYLTQGWRNREVAKALSITEQTVKNHLRSVYDKLGVSDRLELVLYAIHQRLDLPATPASEVTA